MSSAFSVKKILLHELRVVSKKWKQLQQLQVSLQVMSHKVLATNREATSLTGHNPTRPQPPLSSSRITTSLDMSAYTLETS
jgi:hypothetical protein